MATNDRYRLNVDYTYATQVATQNGGVAFVPFVQIGDGSGAGFDFAATFGSPDDAAWNGTDPSATMISILKAIALNTTAP